MLTLIKNKKVAKINKEKFKIVFYQVIIWLDPEQLAEVAESQWCVRLETEVWIMMRWSQVASLTAKVKAFA